MPGTAADIPVVQYWDTGRPPDYLGDLLASFRDRNPGRPHLLFDEERAADFIATRLGEREARAFAACAVPAMRSDYFRYCAVYALGGVYADVGFRCLGPLQGLLEDVDDGLLLRQDPPGFILNGLFAFTRAGHPLPRLALDVATTNVERRPTEMVQMVTGPWIFSALSVLHGLGSCGGASREGSGDDLGPMAEPFRREIAAMTPTAAGRRGIEPMLAPLFETVSDYARIEEAFEGVRVEPLEAAASYVARPEDPLPYKRADDYWINWQRRGQSIYR